MATGPTRNVNVDGYYRKDGTHVGGYTQGRQRAADAWKNAGFVGATAAGSGVATFFTFVEFSFTLITAALMTLTVLLTWLMGLQITKALGLKKPKKPRAAKPRAARTARPAAARSRTSKPRTSRPKSKPARGKAATATARTIADVIAQQEARRTARRERWQGRRQRTAAAVRSGAHRVRTQVQRARAAVDRWRANRAARKSS